MLNLSFVLLAVIFLGCAIYFYVQMVAAKKEVTKQQECHEQLLENFKLIIENLPMVECVFMENFVRSQYCDDDGDESIVYPISGKSSEVKESQKLAKQRLMWKSIYNRLFN